MNARNQLERIAVALERINPPPAHRPEFGDSDTFIWKTSPDRLEPVVEVNRIDLELLVGIDRARDILLDNTKSFAAGAAANNALLWGARGMGKSSLAKAVHAAVATKSTDLKLIEILREDLNSVGRLLGLLRGVRERFILFCDDLSFSAGEHQYKSLKAVLDGGVEGRPHNVVFYATSNRRHLMPRDMIENERSTAVMPSEAVDEKVSLSDRFGLWLGFHPCSQQQYLEMIKRYCDNAGLKLGMELLTSGAIEWQQTRGARSGRVAWQYFVHLSARHADAETA
ncbi:MAG: ATP-binding protein [Rhodobacteraceae bacterium]|nr:ATP-binding protein [Paracoccaceae bacterium]